MVNTEVLHGVVLYRRMDFVTIGIQYNGKRLYCAGVKEERCGMQRRQWKA